eukprot:15234-Rhodomonas_salina.2
MARPRTEVQRVEHICGSMDQDEVELERELQGRAEAEQTSALLSMEERQGTQAPELRQLSV